MLSGFDGLRFTHWQADIRDDGIVVLALDRHDSPVNAMSQDVLLELGCNKIALGHHFDDAVETFLMSLLYEGRIGCFEPVTYLSRTGITQIRPMLYVGEQAITHFAEKYELPVVHNVCPADKHTKRQEVKELIVSLQAQYPDLKSKIFGAMQRQPLPKWGVEPPQREKR